MTDVDREIKRLISYIRSCREANIDCTVTIDKSLTHGVLNALEKIRQYREIGTVEECREAVEKQKPKAPKDSIKIKPVIDENGAYVDADVTVYLLCPNCGEMVGIDENVDKFCHECGQAIQWDNLEGTEDENT